ncbi:hypothetical protein GGTG_09707 [Gaeumannomyces tritici R3-111a-1]|uniref:Uncharacterized protein n=1 Tax=Gaeumannomyces tritici (strain R3-111a-1) TaxID=644352 RepID=J3P872_GAET3|nr:hypothetical protein GGTG_09707 [Gaeumannomyces tritici R3-111a-1]EJT72855.1 hypothetical protein GGTG_09707 [Gaeumannomyces tritici R3-111a-1]
MARSASLHVMLAAHRRGLVWREGDHPAACWRSRSRYRISVPHELSLLFKCRKKQTRLHQGLEHLRHPPWSGIGQRSIPTGRFTPTDRFERQPRPDELCIAFCPYFRLQVICRSVGLPGWPVFGGPAWAALWGLGRMEATRLGRAAMAAGRPSTVPRSPLKMAVWRTWKLQRRDGALAT